MRVFLEMLEATPPYQWTLDKAQLLKAIQEPTSVGKEPSRMTVDPETRSVSLDGNEVASNLTPKLFEYVSAILAAHPHSIPFKEIKKRKGLLGTNSTRLHRDITGAFPKLAKLISTNHTGHFLELPRK